MDKIHKQLLLKALFETQIVKYYSGCSLIDTLKAFKIIKENLYVFFVPNIHTWQLFFDKAFYDLKYFIDGREDLKKFTIGYNK